MKTMDFHSDEWWAWWERDAPHTIGTTMTLRELKARLLKSYKEFPDEVVVYRMGEPEKWRRLTLAGFESVYRRDS